MSRLASEKSRVSGRRPEPSKSKCSVLGLPRPRCGIHGGACWDVRGWAFVSWLVCMSATGDSGILSTQVRLEMSLVSSLGYVQHTLLCGVCPREVSFKGG